MFTEQEVIYLKIERISENQIRCTLNRSDLAERQIELSELAYGSEKARRLFHEMIQTAAAEVGFDVENMPLMVEAIPLNLDSIMLIVTRVEDPDELDTRFSRFSPYSDDDWGEQEDPSEPAEGLLEGAGILNELRQLKTGASAGTDASSRTPVSSSDSTDAHTFRLFIFRNLDETIAAAAALKGMILVHSTLYKDPANGQYCLCIRPAHDEDAFRRTSNILSEYGMLKRSRAGALAYYEEHCETVVASRALDKLARMA